MGKHKLYSLPPIHVFVEAPNFLELGLDFIGEINPTSSNQHRWILTTTEYFIKWVDTNPIKNETNSIVMKFIEENILSKFGCPRELIITNAQDFSCIKMIEFS